MLHPGWITSKTDGQNHYVGVSDLVGLYRVNPRECCVARPELLRALSREAFERMIHLYPDYTGRYELEPLRKDAA
jgi:hypothetical protein